MGKSGDRTGLKQVELSEAEWKERAEALASEESARIQLEEKKRTHNREWNEQLIQHRDRIAQLTEEVDTRMAWVPAQTDMFPENDGGDDDGDGDEAAASDEDEPAPKRRRRSRRSSAATTAESVDAA